MNILLKLEMLLKPHEYAISAMVLVVEISIREALPRRTSVTQSMKVMPVLCLKKRLNADSVILAMRAASPSEICLSNDVCINPITFSIRRLL